MKRMNFINFLLIVSFGVIASGCGTFSGVSPTGDLYGSINGEKMNIADLPSPKTHTLVYGRFVSVDFSKPLTKNDEWSWQYGSLLLFLQVNPKKEPMLILPILTKDAACFLPMEPGQDVVLAREIRSRGVNSRYIISYGIQSYENIAFHVEKPGLQYIGGYLFDSSQVRVKQEDSIEEIKALRSLQRTFTGTQWLPLIEQRIVKLGYAIEEDPNEK